MSDIETQGDHVMPKLVYDNDTKELILNSVKNTRKAGGSWKDAHEAAQKIGYKGSQGGLMQFVAKRGKKAKRSAGRPKGRKNHIKTAKPAAAPSIAGDIASMVDALVQGRVKEALERAIAVLRGTR
jgi:hypothetical protein